MVTDDFSQVGDKISMEVWKIIPSLNTKYAGTVL